MGIGEGEQMSTLDKDYKQDLKYLAEQVCHRVEELEQENSELRYINGTLKEAVRILLSTGDMNQYEQKEATRKLFVMFYGEKLPELLHELVIEQGFEPSEVLPAVEGKLKKVV